MQRTSMSWSVCAGLLLGAAGAPQTAAAACPAAGAVQLTYKDTPVVLSSAPADYQTLLGDDCSKLQPPATLVTAKVQLDNRATTAQVVECTLGTAKSWDYARVTVPAAGSTVLTLVVTNWSGNFGGDNSTKLACRSTSNDSAGNVSASWMKLITEGISDTNVEMSGN